MGKTKQQLIVDNNASFPNNNANYITPALLRDFNRDMIDSTVNQDVYTADSASFNQRIGDLASWSSSLDTNFASQTEFNSYTQSNDAKVNAIIAATSSFVDSAITASSLVTASFAGGTLTFEKGDGSTFGVVIPDVSGSTINTGSFATTGSNTFLGDEIFSGNIDVRDNIYAAYIDMKNAPNGNGGSIFFRASGSNVITGSSEFWSLNPIFQDGDLAIVVQPSNEKAISFGLKDGYTKFWKGLRLESGFDGWDIGNTPLIISSSFGGQTEMLDVKGNVSASNLNLSGALTASILEGYALVGGVGNVSKLVATSSFGGGTTINTGSFATTGSNAFVGNQTITGSVTISGSAQSDLTVVGQIFVSSSAATGTTTPRITVSGSAGTSTINRNSISTRNATDNGGMFPSTIYTQDSVTTDEIGFTVDPSVFGITEWSTGPAFYVNNTAGDTYPAVFGFQNKANYTDGRVAVLTPLVVSSSLYIQSGSTFPDATGSTLLTWNASTGQVAQTPYSSALPVLMAVGAFYSTGSYTTTANVSGSFIFDTSLNVNSVVLANSGSKILVDRSGTYNLQYSIQMDNGSGAADVAVWLKKNGANVADTATIITLASNHKDVLALNLWDTATAGDYYELAYQSTTSNTSFSTIAASGNIPRSPAIILTVNQVR